MAKNTKISKTGITVPDWSLIDATAKSFTKNGIKYDYDRLIKSALWYVHQDVDTKKIAAEFLKYCSAKFDKNDVKLLKILPDFDFYAIGKYAYIANRGAVLSEEHTTAIENYYNNFLEKAQLVKKLEEEQQAPVEEEKSKAPVISIQQRMQEMVAPICGEWDGFLDDMLMGAVTLKDFDPYNNMKASEREIKAAHAKLISDMYASEYAEAQLVAEWKDEEIRECYAHLNTAKLRKEFLGFYEKIISACDTIINENKATRKPRVKKAPTKQKLIAKLKYQESDGTLGLASINPIGMLESNQLWVYNTKTRKLGCYVADEYQGPLSVKGTSITGFDPAKSIQKTVRKPAEVLKGAGKLARTKFDKLFAELTTTETKMNGRINEHTILIKSF